VEVDAPLMRVEGAKVTDAWIRESMEMTSDLSRPQSIERMALLSRKVAAQLPRDASAEQRELIGAARDALDQAYARLEPDSQAWFLSMMPSGFGPSVEGVQGILAQARKSEHRLVRLCYLAYHSTGLNDPMLDAAIRSDDPVVRRIGELLRMESERAASQPAAAQ
jgi:hypothetical protein